MDIKEELSNIEDEFSEFKARSETAYITIIMAVVIPLICIIVYLSRFNTALFALLSVRIALFCVILVLVAIHYILRNTYFISNSRYRAFLKYKIGELKKDYPDLDIVEEIENSLSEGYPDSKKVFYINVTKVLKDK